MRVKFKDGSVVHAGLSGERLPPVIFQGVTMCGLMGRMVRLGIDILPALKGKGN